MNRDDLIFIGFCHRPEWSDEFGYSMLATVAHPRVAAYKGFRSGPIIDYTRNLIVRRFLDTDIEWLLMVDADMSWTQDQLDRICELAGDDRRIVSGWYQRQVGDQTVPICTRGGRHVSDGQGVVKVDTTGCGFLLIHRDVFAKVQHPWFKVEWDDEGCRGEDVTFCDKARTVGFDVFVDTDTHIGHLKTVRI